MDGVRVTSSDVCDLIQKVSASTMSIFRPGSTTPPAILFDAWESFTKRSPKANESIRSIRPDLAKAVDECIDAAGQEWEPQWQRSLLNVRWLYVDLLREILTLSPTGCEVRTRIPRLPQSNRFCADGTNPESAQRCPLL
jgi:Vps16, N-terminal region